MRSMNMIHNHGQPLDSRQLRAFVALANSGSFTRAGMEIGISQSAISHSVKALEEDLGCRLLSRTSKKLHLTPNGEHLLHYSQRILGDMAVVRQSLARLKTWGGTRLRIGAAPCIAQYFLPPVLEGFWKESQKMPVTIQPAGPDLCVELLREDQIDVAIALHPKDSASLQMTPLFVDEIRWVIAPQHPWASSGKVPREEISSQAIVTCSRACSSFGVVESYFARDNHRLNVVYETGDMGALKGFVRAGHGAALLAPWTVQSEIASGSVITLPLGRRSLRRQWCLLRSTGARSGLGTETLSRLAIAAGQTFDGNLDCPKAA